MDKWGVQIDEGQYLRTEDGPVSIWKEMADD